MSTADPMAWFDLVPGDGTRSMVVALPYAGGAGRAFRPLRRYLPADCGLALVDLPGHGRRMGEACLRDADAVVAGLVAALPALPATRLVLVGYSMGGWLAYEVAARMAAAGGTVDDGGQPRIAGLIVCGSRAPQTGLGHPRVAGYPAGEPFLRAAVGLGLAAREMLEVPGLADVFGGALHADLTIVENYGYRPHPRLPVPLCVVGFSADWLTPEPALRAWGEVCQYPPLHRRVEGGHMAVHEQEREFGEAVRAGVDYILSRGSRDPASTGAAERTVSG
jgi:surfactin synthase thioesterase subunit